MKILFCSFGQSRFRFRLLRLFFLIFPILLLILLPFFRQNDSLPVQSFSDKRTYVAAHSTPFAANADAVSASQEKSVETLPQSVVAPFHPDIPLSDELVQYITALCDKKNVPIALVLAVISHESGFNENAVHLNQNGTKDYGLMQLNDVCKDYAKQKYGITDLLEPKNNVTVGIGLLSEYIAKYGIQNGIFAYAVGETGMKNSLQKGITSSKATDEILDEMTRFEALLDQSL